MSPYVSILYSQGFCLFYSTAEVLVKHLVRLNLVNVTGTMFLVRKHPEPVDLRDVREAFEALVEKAGHSPRDVRFSTNFGLEVWVRERLFEKLYKVLFTRQMILARDGEGSGGRDLPNIFVGADKTQVRQIPLVSQRPWPFKFLLELGGMVVIRTTDVRGMMQELRQYLSNFPQFQLGIEMKEAPDGSIVLFTWWFQRSDLLERKKDG